MFCMVFIKFQESVSIARATKAAVAECRPDGWIQFDEGELHHGRTFIEKNATWQMMQLSCPSPTHLINTASIANSTTIAATTPTPASASIRTMDPVLIKTHDLNIFIAPYRENGHGFTNHFNHSVINEDHGFGESQTLQLFPLRSSGDGNESFNEKETEVSVAAAMNANNLPCQFFEFLPLKN